MGFDRSSDFEYPTKKEVTQAIIRLRHLEFQPFGFFSDCELALVPN